VVVALLVLALLGLLGLVVTLRPLRLTPLIFPAFFLAWFTAELAPYLVTLLVPVAVLLVALGGAEGPTGHVAAAISLVDVAGLVYLVARAQGVAALADRALEGMGEGEPYLPGCWRRFFVPLTFSHPDVERTADLPYGSGPRQVLDVYRHSDQRSGCPVLIQVHGGAWVVGDKKGQGGPLMSHLAQRGWVCVAPNYRLSPKATFPDHLIDVKATIAWVREHGAEFGADPGVIILTGGSAGAHLVTLAALTPNDPAYQPGFEDVDTNVQGCAPHYGVYALAGETGQRYARLRQRFLFALKVFTPNDPALLAAGSPIARVNADAPPFLVVHGKNDTIAPAVEARLFVERLRAVSGSSVSYLELPGTQHAFDIFPSIRSAHVVRAAARFAESCRQLSQQR
jgi:acetyl esterase/lipase